MSELLKCKKCDRNWQVKPSLYCDGCAQLILARVFRLVAEPPKAITWEDGTEILTILQNELYP